MQYVASSLNSGCSYKGSFRPKLRHATGTENILIVAAEFADNGYTKLQKFWSLLNLKIPQKTSFYEHCWQFVFPVIDDGWRKNQLKQIEEIKSSGRMLELALDGQCDSSGHNAMFNTVSVINTVTNKLISFRVVQVKVCNYLNETTHYVSFCNFCVLLAQRQCHNIKTTMKPNGNCDIYIETCFGRNFCEQKLSWFCWFFFLFDESFCHTYTTLSWGKLLHLNGRQNFMIYHNVMHVLSFETSKPFFFFQIFYTARSWH